MAAGELRERSARGFEITAFELTLRVVDLRQRSVFGRAVIGCNHAKERRGRFELALLEVRLGS